MPGEFDDLVPGEKGVGVVDAPAAEATGAFDDLVPEAKTAKGAFDELIPGPESAKGAFDEFKPAKEKEKPGTVGGSYEAYAAQGNVFPLSKVTKPLLEIVPKATVEEMRAAMNPPGNRLGIELPSAFGPSSYGAQPSLPAPSAPLDLPEKTVKVATGVQNSVADSVNFFTSPLGISTLGMGALPKAAQSTVALAFATQMALQVPETARQLGEELGKPESDRDYQKIAKLTTDAVTATGFAAMGGAHAAGPLVEATGAYSRGIKPEVQSPKPKVQSAILSEFGGVSDLPVPERPETIEAQLQWLKEGKRKAVLVTPGSEAVPMIPEGMEATSTTAGTVFYDPKQVTKDEVHAAAADDKLGNLLGYGSHKKPEFGPSAVVVVRSPEGLEKQAVVADPGNVASVVKAAGDVADEGDTITLEDGKDVIAERQGAAPAGPSRIEQKAFREMSDSREDLPTSLVKQMGVEPGALPAGYELQGDRYVWKEPSKTETVAQRLVRENQEAMARLREQKAANEGNEDPDWNVPEEPTERPSEGTPIEIQDERPPDILDWIQGNYEHGVRSTSAKDYGELVNQFDAAVKSFADDAAGQRGKEATAKRKAARSMSRILNEDRGEAADKVLGEMHNQGLYRRLESEDDLIGAMVKAAEARKAWEAERRAAPDRIEAWLNRAIEATKPGIEWTGQTSLGVAKVPAWLAQEAAHGALQVARAVYVKGRDLVAAIGAAVEHVRGMNVPGFNAGELQDWLAGTLGERQTGQKVAASTAVSDPVKDSIRQYLYEKRSNATDEELARGIVQRSGLDGAVEILRDPPGNLPQATWSKLVGEVTRGLAAHELEARARGDQATAEGLAQRQAKLWDEMLPRITEMAQGLQALNDIVDMSPDAQVARLKNRLERVADEKVNKLAPEVETARGALDEGRKAGTEQVRQDPAVNEAARKAVDAAIEDSEEVKKAVVMELAGPWAQSPHILLHAKQAMQGMLADVMRGRERPAGMNAAQHARAILGDLSQRAAEIFAGHIQGAEPGVTLVKKLQERLGLSEARARELATQLSQEWDRQLKAAQAKIPKRIATMRATRERNLGQSLNSPTAAVDAAIRRQLDALNVKLGDVLKQEAGRQEETAAHVAERIVQASGLTGEAADTLRTVLKNRWDAIVTDAQRRALERLQTASGVKVGGKIKGAFEKAVELERLGALTSERFYDVVKQQLKLKQLTQADAAELRRLVKRAQELPEGFLRQQAAADVEKFTGKLSGEASLAQLPMAIFYANILSGVTTYAKIGLENINMLASSTVAGLLARPRELLHPVDFVRTLAGSYKRGLAKGALQAASTLKTGVVTGVWAKARTPTILEMKPFGEKMDVLNFWKWFTRGISTAHETTFKPAWELKQSLIAQDMARSEGLSGRALQQRVADLLANTEQHVTDARAQAVNELRQTGTMSRMNLARRTREIVEQRREMNMPGSTESAREFALRVAYLNEPYGFMGFIAKSIQKVLETARREYPVLGTAAKTQLPFTTIVTNILNEKLNWTPAGVARAVWSHKTGELYGREALPGERAELYAKAIVGTAALSVLGTLFGDHVHGNGPSDPHKRKQLQADGWVPHSIEWNGRYYSYMNTPAALGLAWIGNWKDWHRYGKGDQADGETRAAFAGKAVANAIISQGMLDSLKRFVEAFGSESTSEGASKLEKLGARTASSFVVPNLLQQGDRIWDPTVYDTTGMEALLKGQIPFVRRMNKPTLTVLGDTVQVGPFHYWAGKVTDDPLLRTLAEKQAWVPEPGKNQIIGDKKRGPDYYRAMTPDEYYDFVAKSGAEIRRRLTENLDVIATSEPDKARKYVQRIASEEHAKALKSFE